MKNVDLAPEERAIIAAARDALQPTEIQRARVRKGLDAKVAAGVAAPALATSAAFATFLKIGMGVAIAGVVGTGAVYYAAPRLSLPPAEKPRTTLPHSLASAPARTPEAITVPDLAPTIAPETPLPAAQRPAPSRPRATAHRREPDLVTPADLAGELGVLTQVNAATKQGQVARADELLRSYDQRYPSGQLIQERAAAGILVHCAAGRVQSARAEARRFIERWPRSPLVARIQGSCAHESKEESKGP
jgi:hypothetical protein